VSTNFTTRARLDNKPTGYSEAAHYTEMVATCQ
jgi:hypothetical protein